MNAVALIEETAINAAPPTPGAAHRMAPEPKAEAAVDAPGFGEVAIAPLTLALLAVFVAATAGITFFTDNFTAAVGFGAFLAFWLGGGFGFLIGGIRWGLLQEAAHAQEGTVQ